MVSIWLHSQDSNFNYTENDLLRSSDGIKLWCNKKSWVVFLLFAVVDQFFFFLSLVFLFGYSLYGLLNILSMII